MILCLSGGGRASVAGFDGAVEAAMVSRCADDRCAGPSLLRCSGLTGSGCSSLPSRVSLEPSASGVTRLRDDSGVDGSFLACILLSSTV